MKNQNDDAVLAVIIIVAIVVLAVVYTIRVFFLLTLSRCLSRIRERNRDMQPGLVWLYLIPCVDMVWAFFMIIYTAGSLRKEYQDRGWRTADEQFGQGVGLGFAVCYVLANIPYIGGLFGLAALVCFIIYWVQIAGYSKRLVEESYDRDRAYDDYDDDRDRPYRDVDDRDRGYDDQRIRE
jgi:amino acid transporter